MALARIISRSHQCSRELALDLLARGYAVEIVSPDAIPDNLADLELRLDADNANELKASVAAHDGAHAASLDFIHHLRAPMGDFVRRSPQASQPISFPAQPVNFNAEPGFAGDLELPSENWRAPEPAGPKLQILPEVEESARLLSPPEALPTSPNEVARPARLALAKEMATNAWRNLNVKFLYLASLALRFCHSRLKIRIRSNGWLRHAGLTIAATLSEERFWRVGLRIAAVLLMALVLGRGVRRASTASANPASQVQPARMEAVPSVAAAPSEENREDVAVPSVAPSAAGTSETKSAQVSSKPAAPVARTSSRKSGAVRPRHREDDLVARDTVIYFDGSTAISPVKDSRRRASSQK